MTIIPEPSSPGYYFSTPPLWSALTSFCIDAARRKDPKRGDEPLLERTLSFVDLLLLAIGGTFGSGLFLLAGRTARDIAGPAVTLSFAAAAIACVFSGISYAEMASRMPACGGAYSFVYSTVGEFAAFLVGMCLTLEYGVSSAAVARAWGAYVGEPFRALPAWVTGHGSNWSGLGFALMCAVSFLVALGMKEAKWVINGATAIYGVVVVAVIGVGIPSVNATNWTPFVPYGAKSILTGASAVFFSYIGFDEVATVAEEAKDASFTVPLAILASLFVVASLYMVSTLVLTGMVKYTNIDFDAPFPAAFRAKGMPVLASMIGVGTAMGMANTTLVGLLAQSRIFLAMGQDGLIPRSLGQNARRSTVICGAIVALLALRAPTQALTDVVSGGTLLAFLGTNASLLLTRYRLLPNNPRFGSSMVYVYVAGTLIFGLTVRSQTETILRIPTFALVSPLVLVPAYLISLDNLGRGTDGEPLRPVFKSPLVPAIPLLGVLTTAVLFMQLSRKALSALGLWLFLSSLVYCVYGREHSEASFGVQNRIVNERTAIIRPSPSGEQFL